MAPAVPRAPAQPVSLKVLSLQGASIVEEWTDSGTIRFKTAVANLVSLRRLEASITGAGHRITLELYDLPRDDNVTMMSHNPIEWRVLTYHTLHGTGDWGCKIHDVAASLGLDLAKVRSVVAFLEDQGELYSTIDDDHHKSTE